MNHDDYAALEVDCDPGTEPDAAPSDGPLLDLLDALVEERGRAPAAKPLGEPPHPGSLLRSTASVPAGAAGAA